MGAKRKEEDEMKLFANIYPPISRVCFKLMLGFNFSKLERSVCLNIYLLFVHFQFWWYTKEAVE